MTATNSVKKTDAAAAEEGVYSPLFPEAQDPQTGAPIYADQIARIAISRQFPGRRGPQRTKVALSEFETADGEDFKVDPFETTEDDLEEQFGGGQYWIQPVNYKGKLMGCGRTLNLAGPMRPGIKALYAHPGLRGRPTWRRDEEEPGEDGEPPPEGPPAPPWADPRAAAPPGYPPPWGYPPAAPPGPPRDELVATLREELEDLRKAHRRETERLADEHRDALRRKDRELDEALSEATAKRRALEADASRATEDLRRTVEDERRRWNRELDENYDRRRADVTEERERAQRRVLELEQTLSATRGALEKRVADLTAEVLDLRRDLADGPPAAEPPPPPLAGASVLPEGAPWWAAMAAMAAPHIVKTVVDLNAARPPAPATGVPAPQVLQGSVPPQYVPPQAYVPPQPYVPPPSPPQLQPAHVPPPVAAAAPAPAPAAPPSPQRSLFVYGPAITIPVGGRAGTPVIAAPPPATVPPPTVAPPTATSGLAPDDADDGPSDAGGGWADAPA